MKLEDLAGAVALAAALKKEKAELEIAKSASLVMMTVEEARGGRVAFTLVPTAVAAARDEVEDDQGILFDAVVDVVVMWHQRRIDRYSKALAKLGVEP